MKVACVVLLLVVATSLLALAMPNTTATDETFNEFYDGYIYATDSDYTTAYYATSGTEDDSDLGLMYIGQTYYGGAGGSMYEIYRSFVYFDTSSIPDDAIVSSANLSLYVSSDYSDTDFNVTIQEGTGIYPHNPLQAGDYYYSYYSGNGGNRSTSTITGSGYWNITLTAEGLTWIELAAYTKFVLRSNRDISQTTPTGDEHIRCSQATHTKLYVEVATYTYTFYGMYDENTGYLKTPTERAVNVTAYYVGQNPESFEVNATYEYGTSEIPLYFIMNTTTYTREYWLSTEEANVDIYIFAANTTGYAVNFLDLAGVLTTSSLVEAKRYVNGSLMTVEKRAVDTENKVAFALVNGAKYTLVIRDGTTYTFGEILFTSTTSLTLTLRGINFPKEVLLTYKYVRIYALRTFAEPNGTITITYEDTLELTGSVEIYINYRNGTTAYHPDAETSDSFSHQWPNAMNDTDYQIECVIDHGRYGVTTWKQFAPRTFTENPWDNLAFMGELPFNTNVLIGAFIILLVGGGFSQVNAYVGAILATLTAAALTVIGWISITPGILLTAFTFSILMGVVAMKRGLR